MFCTFYFTTEDVIVFLKEILRVRKPTGQIILNLDNQSIFTSKEFQLLLIITMLLSVMLLPMDMEIKFRKDLIQLLKQELEKKLLLSRYQEPNANQKKTSLDKLLNYFEYESVKLFIFESIEEYNNNPHRGDRMLNTSPNIMNDALTTQNNEILIPDQVLSINDNSDEAINIAMYKADIFEYFCIQMVVNSLEEFKQQNQTEFDKLHQQIAALREENKQLAAEKHILSQESADRQREAEIKRLRREKRNQAKKLDIRNAIKFEELIIILELIEKEYSDPLTKARVYLAILIMYLTGLRISNLLLLKKSNIEDLLVRYETTIRIIKRGPSQHTLCISNSGAKLLQECQPKYEILLNQVATWSDFVFFAPRNPSQPIDRTSFNKQINSLLIKASIILEKNIRSHSFRATFVTDLLEESVPIEKVKDIVGHSDIKTTETYRRSIFF